MRLQAASSRCWQGSGELHRVEQRGACWQGSGELASATEDSDLLDLDLDVDTGGEVEALERLHRLGGRLDDVDEALVDAHLEVLAGVLVDVGAADDAVAVDLGGQRHGATDLR